MSRARQLPVGLALGFFAVQIGAMLAPARMTGIGALLDVTPFLVPLAASAACLVVARGRPTQDRLVWTFLSFGAIAWAIGDIGFSIYTIFDYDPTGLTGADAGYLALIPLWAAALVVHPSRSRRSIDRVGTAVDALAIILVVGTLTAAYVLGPTLSESGDFGGAIVNLIYPVGDLMLLAVVISIYARSSDRLHAADLLIAGAATVFVIADIGYARFATLDAYDVGHPVDLAWSFAFVLVALAAGRTLSGKRFEDEDRAVVPLLAIFGIAGMIGLSAVAVVTRMENRIVLSGGVIVGLLLISRLVILLFDRARVLRSYDEKVRELEEANVARERFIATISHDLRSPLASISGFAELLREPEIARDPKQVAEMTLSIERNARRLARLTEDLLCAGQFATGHPPPLRLAAVDLRRVAEEAMQDMGRGDQVNVQGSRWIYAMADKNRVQQILVNLVENAFKHSGSNEASISIRSEEEGPVLEVSDHGVGIPAERIAEIFDPFVGDHRNTSSVGLGLYVVRNLVAAMKGRISVTSEADAGTSFRIVLPAAVQESALLDTSPAVPVAD